MRGHRDRARVRDAHRDAVDTDRGGDPEVSGDIPHGPREGFPVKVRLRAMEQQQVPAGCPHQVQHERRLAVVHEGAVLERHARPTGAVVHQPVHVERDHPGGRVGLQQVGGDQRTRMSGVDRTTQRVHHHPRVELLQAPGTTSHVLDPPDDAGDDLGGLDTTGLLGALVRGLLLRRLLLGLFLGLFRCVPVSEVPSVQLLRIHSAPPTASNALMVSTPRPPAPFPRRWPSWRPRSVE